MPKHKSGSGSKAQQCVDRPLSHADTAQEPGSRKWGSSSLSVTVIVDLSGHMQVKAAKTLSERGSPVRGFGPHLPLPLLMMPGELGNEEGTVTVNRPIVLQLLAAQLSVYY